FSPDRLLEEASLLQELGIQKVLLFGIPDHKDEYGSAAYHKDNVVAEAVSLLKESFPGLTLMTDVCLCAYTTHGHCGIINGKDKSIDNSETLSALSRIALSHAEAGADYVAPSAMAAGQVAAIRSALNRNGYGKTRILGYSAKFASQFYGPFRDAADSYPKFGDRREYQLAYLDRERAIKEASDDIEEGADIIMVKPSLAYLDIIRDIRNGLDHPLAAYNVSGEYVFIKNGAREGLWDEREMVFETLSAIKRAGADMIITYHAKEIALWNKEGSIS
ncbi:MAG: porphobilinogen synthase, partial [Candidatus Omnitrophica bacterium]|nr:porphobilinogen synthase [Candidatus Omnitrophota bacterium]